jgi:hypothetical protein
VFGGVWLTDEGAVFAFTYRATDAQIADVLSHLESWVPYTTVRVDFSEAELNAVSERVLEDGLNPETGVMSVGVDLIGNAVVIGILPAGFCARQAELQQRYGEVRLTFVATEGDVGAPEGDLGTPGASPSPMTSGQPQGSGVPFCPSPIPSASLPAMSPAPSPSGGPAAS